MTLEHFKTLKQTNEIKFKTRYEFGQIHAKYSTRTHIKTKSTPQQHTQIQQICPTRVTYFPGRPPPPIKPK